MNAKLKLLTQLLRTTAATEILPRWHHICAENKADGSVVTATDLAVQTRITAALALVFPDIPLLGEEMTATEQQRLLAATEHRIWILDPLDGTSNYAGGFPFFAISLALIEQGKVTHGAIYDPVRDECFTAARGQGAWLNGEPIQPFTAGAALSDCLAMIDLKRLPPSTLATLFRAGGFRSQRNLGSVALDWCWLASGRFQLYLHGGQRLWDYAAGRLIAKEAGAAVRHYQPEKMTLTTELTLESQLAIAAATPELLERWQAFVALQ
ncbi:inositol monophosphatase [Chromatium weissei]|nr:inositol monophosphatase [Chromatium weissei]